MKYRRFVRAIALSGALAITACDDDGTRDGATADGTGSADATDDTTAEPDTELYDATTVVGTQLPPDTTTATETVELTDSTTTPDTTTPTTAATDAGEDTEIQVMDGPLAPPDMPA